MLAVVRIRSPVTGGKTEDTLEMLRLDSINSCAIVPETADYKGMVRRVKDIVTWGEINKETLVEMLKKRLRLKGNKRIDGKYLKSIGFDSFEALADDLISNKVKLKDFPQLQPVFKLTPPSQGLKSIKVHYPKGDLGNRKKEINELIMRMI